MNTDKKVLILTDVEQGIESIIKEMTDADSENMVVIRSFDTTIVHPYDEIMSSIIQFVYNDNIEAIYVVGSSDKTATDIKKKIQSESIPALNYLFKHHMPELQADTVEEWLKTDSSHESVKKSVNLISRHPLIPSHIKVQGIVVDDHALISVSA
ncbi:carbonic anhydrase [Jeotgalibacillus sp. R-1-5s-1]|uniref:carbonic anhydrase n=1 Tax=Jeotgalibacillus sp. R-1-5s-1 TaxID=2555897 RepID=UPI00106C27F8|nr:carbonic anhydrase [Jeotgalibacillus sp. R-1-5s-1]TFD92940.1 carbonic anhydrase [Jeotgalibacillus sp. R-1-5s-1]